MGMNRSGLALVALILTGSVGVATADAPGAESPIGVASAYLDAMESGDLEAAERLFAASSLIFESGKVEGPWRRYREHHIGPELKHIASFEITRGEPDVRTSADGTLAYVAWSIQYRVGFTTDREPSESLGTVTFALVREEGGYRISHLHWSRRRK